MRPLVSLLASAALAVALPAAAATFLVLPDGSGDTPSIADALRLAVSGDVIELGDGVFGGLGNAGLATDGRALTLRSHSGNPGACVIDGAAATTSLLRIGGGGSELCRIEGIGFRGAALSNADGGALFIESGAPRIANCRFSDNAAHRGGAVLCTGGAPRFENCLFVDNRASTGGGALAATEAADVTVTGCRFAGNTAAYGGAFFVDRASLTLAGNIVVGNSASERGGAIYAGDHASLDVATCTLAWNDAPAGCGLTLVTFANAALRRTILAFGAGGEAVDLRYDATIAVSCSDLFGNAGGDWTGALAAQANQAGNLAADPRFCGDADDQNVGLAADSPCAAGASACGAMGAKPVSCAGREARETSLGAVKTLYGRGGD